MLGDGSPSEITLYTLRSNCTKFGALSALSPNPQKLQLSNYTISSFAMNLLYSIPPTEVTPTQRKKPWYCCSLSIYMTNWGKRLDVTVGDILKFISGSEKILPHAFTAYQR